MTTMTAAEAAELEAIMAAYKNVLALPDLETIEEKPNMHDNDVQYDVMRDSLVRYLGYANEVGESFKGIVPKLLVRHSKPSFAVFFGVYIWLGCRCHPTLLRTVMRSLTPS